ncbi:hypothetical protein AQJ43_37780 [Streptomyces avermitilis]|uniref:Uncharacterized protein n=2 Tax=Streptomyces avermitilis TaxID=33903 RepID=A0A143SZL4_STRAW|nr:hypothetical protein [Streptomyces avermitilis]KUN46666.1 hypothetical protein AQJ43_37780 [Streptomyces avermitilis]BAU77597.1 hypothetical protein SAVERM_2p154 [Streptomyces avermitilis MA-4680 = NBRC 14893]GDY70264.1 hypothetical protein SAV14893_096570 [Streptomyces avermitilis]GDY80572.1 hypothetical protein SAV31267_100570 [Streptomyces avermitilis]
MKITIEGASEEFERKLLELLAEHRHELAVTADTEWTVERAERYLRSLPAGARRFAEIVVVEGDGYAEADTLRRFVGKLNGPTVALSRAIPRGVREGWWPDGTTAPITVVYDPENPSWQKAIAYEMTRANVPVFHEALRNLLLSSARPWSGEAPSALDAPTGWAAADDIPRVLDPDNSDFEQGS